MNMITENGYKKFWIKDDTYTLVDEELYPILKRWKWQIDTNGYVCRTISYPYFKTSRLHRIIATIKYGILADDNFIVDHIDRNQLNNTISNLRLVSRNVNQHNMKKQSFTSSKFIGVVWDVERNKWRADIKLKGKRKFAGRFKTEKEAAIARDKKAIELYGKYARLNFPEMFKDQL